MDGETNGGQEATQGAQGQEAQEQQQEGAQGQQEVTGGSTPDYEKQIAERDEKIAALEAQVAEAAKTAEAAVLSIWEESRRRFGFRKVHARLVGDFPESAGTTRYRVRKCMRELGIRGACPSASRRTTVPDKGAPARPDLIRRDFESPVPTCRLVGDITHMRATSGLIYLATVTGPCTRMVVGWAIADNMRAELVVSAMEMAWGRGYVAGDAIFHSDRGSQHASALFGEWARSHDVRLSVGRTGSCHDNAVAEFFFGAPENEWLHRERLADAETTRHLTIEFIESYHDRYRPHEAIGDRVPAEVMDEFLLRFEKGMSHDQEVMMAA